MTKTKKTVKNEGKTKNVKPKKEPKSQPMTLAEKIFVEQFNQHLKGKETKEYPRILEDL